MRCFTQLSHHELVRIVSLKYIGLLTFVIAFSGQTCSADAVAIVDGDTIDLGEVRYRINGIDAPEAGQKCGSPSGDWTCGEEAMRRLAALVEGATVECEPLADDGRGRFIATCLADGVDVGSEMVRTGYAWAFIRYSDVYVLQEVEARSTGAVVWRGEPQRPWDYRADRWRSAETAAPEGCPIKGNISRHGMIYHPTWSPWYEKTRINTARGERCFCSEEEAVEAGWRAPRYR